MTILRSVAIVLAAGLLVHLYATICMGIVGLFVKLDIEDTGNDKAQFLLMIPVLLGAFIFLLATWPAIENLRDELSSIGDEFNLRGRLQIWKRRLKALVSD
jgi:hypothetical protein